MQTIIGVIICPWCYLPFIGGDDSREEFICPHCNRRINQWDIEEELSGDV
jgi:hypothetical protein